MKQKSIVQLACALSIGLAVGVNAASVGANFVGRNAPASLLPNEKAGLVEQAFWNNIDDSTTTPPESGTSASLLDDSGKFTSVTVSFKGNDSWESNGPSDTPNDRLMRGIIKQQGANTSGNFSLNNLGSGPYDVIVYMGMDADGVSADISVGGTTKPVLQSHQFGGSFIQADAATVGNYVKFTGVTPSAGVIPIAMKYLAGGNGAGMAAIQVVGASFPVNTVAASIVTQPKNSTVPVGSRGAFSITGNANNLNFQWYKNGSAIPGATSASYTTAVTTAADNGTKYKVTLANNVNTVTSDEVVLNALTPVVAKGFLNVEFYTGFGGTAVTDLTGNANYIAGVPNESRLIVGFDTPNGYGDNYGAKVSGFIIPKVTGNYNFFIRSDDASALYLSTDEKPANLSVDPIAFETGCCKAFLEPGAGDVTSGTITLTGGKSYYVVALMKEGGGGDYLQVAMKLESDTTAAADLKPVGGDQIGTLVLPDAVITVSTAPSSVTVSELNPAKFTVAATAATPRGAVPVRYQWQKNGIDIAGANGATYKAPSSTLADSGTKYAVVIGAPGAPDTNKEVILTVVPDTTPPAIVSVGGVSKKAVGVEVSVVVNEPLTTPASVTLANFKLSSGTVTAARYLENAAGLDSRERAVILSTTGLTAGNSYTLTVSGLKDIKGNTSGSVTTPFTLSKMTWVDLARPSAFIQDVVVVGTNGFNIINGGSSYWGTDDDATFVYEEITGDFDKVARLEGQDPSSNWARAGIAARESLDAHDAEASRYQQVHANPSPKKFDGTDSNQGYETNRRLTTGASTSSSNGDAGANGPQYPNAWLRLMRTGDVIHMLRSTDGFTWTSIGLTDFNPADGSGSALPAKMFVGPVFGAENGNVTEGSRNSWNAQFRQYGDFASTEAAGKQTYAIGVNFTDDNRDGVVGPADVAGADAGAQANWNNAFGVTSEARGPLNLKADKGGVAQTTTATVEWSGVPNTWASTGRGEENNPLKGSDHLLMSGFLDTSADSTTQIKITGLPTSLTSGKYDVVVYALGGVAGGRGGAYRVTDANGNTLSGYNYVVSPQNPATLTRAVPSAAVKPGDGATYSEGSYIVFTGLSAASIIIEGTTQVVSVGGVDVDVGVGGAHRAPINAVQLVTPSGLFDVVAVNPTIKIEAGKIVFTGKLMQADTVTGTFTEVIGATSPFSLTPASGNISAPNSNLS